MILDLSLADKDGNDVTYHETATRCITYATGLLAGGVAAPRTDGRRVLPQAHGGIDPTKYTDGKIITLGHELTAATFAALEQDWRDVVAPIQHTLDHGPALLKWTQGGDDGTDLELQRLVKVAAEVDQPLEGGAKLFAFTSQFFSEDPRAYDQAPFEATGDPLSEGVGGGKTYPFTYTHNIVAGEGGHRVYAESSGGAVSVAVGGVKSTPPVFRLYGYALNPAIVNLDTGERLQFGASVAVPSAEIANGNYLEIDVKNRTVYLNGDETVNQRNLFNPAASTWFELPPDTTTNLQLVAQDFDAGAYLYVTGRDAY